MTIVNSGQIQFVTAGQDIQNTTVLSGGAQWVDSGGEADFTVISSGGELIDFGVTATPGPETP